jgi:hypothetical protein
MTRYLLCLSLAAAMIAGCATAPHLTLDQVKKRRVYQASKSEIMQAARLFATKEMFSVQSFEEETGRIWGTKTVAARRDEDAKVIRWQTFVLPDSPGKWEVSALFRYAVPAEQLSREEESMLVDCYTLFFSQIEQVAPYP